VIARKIPDPSGERIVEDLTTGLTGARTIFEGKTFRAQVWSRPAGVTSLRI
jgi:hypothetical protein